MPPRRVLVSPVRHRVTRRSSRDTSTCWIAGDRDAGQDPVITGYERSIIAERVSLPRRFRDYFRCLGKKHGA